MFKKIAIILMLSLIVFSCAKKEEQSVAKEEIVTLTVSQLAKDIDGYADKTIKLKGTVSHVCRKSGKKLFLIGEEGQNFKITAGDNISVFDMALEGSEVTVEGKVVEIKAAMESHENHDNHEGNDADECSTKQIANYSLVCQKLIENK
ncbi:MAG: hypothetical protein KAR38_03805 [Calditrichia bacterium]|nr:hypothetical protein [Calditrichia bacterium]